jgi:hypothetical protein
MLPPTESIRIQYQYAQHWLGADLADRFGRFEFDEPGRMLVIAAAWLPWERARSERALDYVATREFRDLGSVVQSVEKGNRVTMPRGRQERFWRDPRYRSTLVFDFYWPQADTVAKYYVATVARRRGLYQQLALRAWQLERGELPDRLEELVGPFFERTPLDPFTAEPFRYFPKGLPGPIVRQEGGPYDRRETVLVPAGKPLVWSASPDVVINKSARDVLGKYQKVENGRGYRASTELEVWSWGLVFPIP